MLLYLKSSPGSMTKQMIYAKKAEDVTDGKTLSHGVPYSSNMKPCIITYLSRSGNSNRRQDCPISEPLLFSKFFKRMKPFLQLNAISYGFDEDIGKYFEQVGLADQRTVSGRVLLLPQAGSTLSTNLQQIFANTNANDLENIYKMPLSEQTNLLSGLSRLEFVSSPLTGMTSDFLTLHEGGAHVKPTVRLANSTPVFIQAAVDVAKPINVTSNIVTLMDAETTLTPYGSSVAVNSGASPLKLVTHGRKSAFDICITLKLSTDTSS
jgi:hypothetical protein